MKKIILCVIVSMVIVLSVLTYGPIVSSDRDIPQEYIEAIEEQSKGLYSNILPLVPVYVSMDEYVDGKVYYTIYYFPFGSVKMSYGDHVYNIEKSLLPL